MMIFFFFSYFHHFFLSCLVKLLNIGLCIRKVKKKKTTTVFLQAKIIVQKPVMCSIFHINETNRSISINWEVGVDVYLYIYDYTK